MEGRPYSTRPGVRVRIEELGYEFQTLNDCAIFLGVEPAWLGKVSRGAGGLCTVKGYHIIRVEDGYQNFESRRGRPGRQVRIVETGEEFKSISDCARAINGSVGTISDILYGNRYRTSHKGFTFEFI